MISSFDNGRYLGLESIVFKFFWRDDKFMFYVCFISFPNKECEVFIPRPWLMRHPPSPRESHLSGLRTEYYWYWLLSVLTTRLWMKFMQNTEKFVASTRDGLSWTAWLLGKIKRAFYSVCCVRVETISVYNDLSRNEACKSSPSSQSGTLERGQMWTMNAESGVIEMLVCH